MEKKSLPTDLQMLESELDLLDDGRTSMMHTVNDGGSDNDSYDPEELERELAE